MVDRFIIELEPAVWYRDWAGTHRTTNINDAHIFGSAVRATKEIVKACKHRPYPNARVVAVSTVVQPIEETVHIRSLSEQVKAILPRTMYRFSALAPDIASILVDVTSVRNRLELVDLDDIPGMIAEMELAIAGLSTATKEESKRAASERVAPTVREIIRERSPEGARRRDVEERFQRVGERIRAASVPSGIPRDPATERLLARIAELEAWQADAREKAKKDPPFPHVWWASLTPGQREHYFKGERLLLAQRAREEEKWAPVTRGTLLGNMTAEQVAALPVWSEFTEGDGESDGYGRIKRTSEGWMGFRGHWRTIRSFRPENFNPDRVLICIGTPEDQNRSTEWPFGKLP